MLTEINNRTKKRIDVALVKRIVRIFGRIHRLADRELSLAFVGDQEIKKINQAYRRLNKATDVLAFVGEGKFLGEIIIDYAQVERQAKQFDNTARQELIFILVHGLLHLIGYDDKTEKGRLEMIKRGEEFIKKFN